MTPAETLREATHRGLIDEADTSVIFYDPTVFEAQVRRVQAAFPRGSVHAVAVKTNPLVCILERASQLGLAAEAASFEEMLLAHHAGFADRLIWDSPAKTKAEAYQSATLRPFLVNMNSLEELKLFASLDMLHLGLRVNPEIEPDAIPSMSVGQRASKFGIPISRKEDIIACCISDPRIMALHVHTSSGSRSLEPLVEGVSRTLQLAEEINYRCAVSGLERRITAIDIGGGLPMAATEDTTLSVERYAEMLRQRCPHLFSPRYRVLTEFGRYYHYASGWTATRIACVQTDRDVANVIVHIGADAFVREVYDPEHWMLQFGLASSEPEHAAANRYRVCGPLCFEGDVLGSLHSRQRPVEGDWLIVLNTGANTYSLWSRHCSRPFPKVIFANQDSNDLQIMKSRERVSDLIAFWS